MKTLLQTIEENDEKFIEKGADLEHRRWAGWQNYMHSKMIHIPLLPREFTVEKGMLLPDHLYHRWERQIITDYKDLSEQEKESDRKEVRKYVPLLKEMRIKELEALVEIIEKRKSNNPTYVCYSDVNRALDDIVQTIQETINQLKN